MLFFKKRKDGGPESTVTGYWLVELKRLFSILFLRFEGRSREAYHSHAFNAISWVLKGRLVEHDLSRPDEQIDRPRTTVYTPSFKPIFTPRDKVHKVDSDGVTLVLTFRGPWTDTWIEHRPTGLVTLTHGRKEV